MSRASTGMCCGLLRLEQVGEQVKVGSLVAPQVARCFALDQQFVVIEKSRTIVFQCLVERLPMAIHQQHIVGNDELAFGVLYADRERRAERATVAVGRRYGKGMERDRV